jgi:hypothetical protein
MKAYAPFVDLDDHRRPRPVPTLQLLDDGDHKRADAPSASSTERLQHRAET